MDAQWISAAVVVLLLAGFLWRSGASARRTIIIVGLAVLGIVATALFWEWVASGDS